MKILELFSGTESFSKVARERGHECFTVDMDRSFNPDLCIDILDFDISMLPEEFRNPDLIWASPPCTTFSVASIRHYWENGKPKNEKSLLGIKIVKKTIEIIKELNPHFFVIENPRGMLRKQEVVQQLKRDTVTYCQYGLTIQKPTDLWNNLNHEFREMCKPGAPCHQRAGRGARKGVQGIYSKGWEKSRGSSAKLRAVVPRELCLEIIKHCEEEKRMKPKIIILKLNEDILEYERHYGEELTNKDIALLRLGLSALDNELLEEFLSRDPQYFISDDSKDLGEE